MRIKWEVNDGYMGGSRPQHLELDDQDILECQDVEEAMQLVDGAIDEALLQMGGAYDGDDVRARVAELLHGGGADHEV